MYKANEYVKKVGSTDTYKIVAINDIRTHILSQEDYDYLKQKVVNDSGILKAQTLEKVFEKDIYR